MSESVIEARSLTKQYGVNPALSDIALTVPKGEVFGFLGPNGAGKTTFMKLMLRFVHPTSGMLLVLGKTPEQLDFRRVGYLPEKIVIQKFLTGREFLKLQANLRNLSDIDNRVNRSLEMVQMLEHGDKRVGDYSKGMVQRVGFANAIMGEPDLILLDEPNSGLDPLAVTEMRELILKERDRGATVFINSHQLLEVEKTCDRVAILNKGQLVAQGSSQELSASGAGIRVQFKELLPAVKEFIQKLDAQAKFAGNRADLILRDSEDERMFPSRLIDLGAHILEYSQSHESLEESFRRLVGPGQGVS